MRKLWHRILAFDLNIDKKPAITVAMRFARENTNDIGDTLSVSTSSMLIMEFKKYIFLCAIEIKARKHDASGDKVHIIAPYPAPPLIQKVWDLLILYTDHYEQLCQAAFTQFDSESIQTCLYWLDKPSTSSDS